MANFKKKLDANRVKLLLGKDGEDLLGEEVYLYTTQELQTSISQSYEPLLPSGSNVLLTLLSSATKGRIPSGQIKQQGFQIWKGTSPVNISLTCELVMNESGKKDVVGPVATLQSYAVPGVNGSTLVPPGPSIFRALEGLGGDTKVGGMIQQVIDSARNAGLTEEKGTLYIKVGSFLTLPNMVLENVSCTWSTSFDDEFYPIKCTLSLDLKGTEIASTAFVSQMYGDGIKIGAYKKQYYDAETYLNTDSDKIVDPDSSTAG